MRFSNASSIVTPTGSGTTVLCDTTLTLPGRTLTSLGLKRYVAVLHNIAAGTLRISWKKTADQATWDIFYTVAVPIPAAGTVSDIHDFAIDGIPYMKAEWVNGGVDQDATWARLDQKFEHGERSAQS